MATKRCCVPTCDNNSYNNNTCYFIVPKDPVMKQIWKENLRCDSVGESEMKYVCERHFDTECVYSNGTHKRLLKRAAPRTEGPGALGGTLTHEFVPSDQQQGGGAAKRTVVYGNKYKMYALDMYYRSPHSYKVLHRTFRLPRISTLYRMSIPDTSLSLALVKTMKLKVDYMTRAQKQCVICIGTIRVAPEIQYDASTDTVSGLHDRGGSTKLCVAHDVLIVAVRGLFHPWKQALAYMCLSQLEDVGATKKLIEDIITKVLRTGLEVQAVVSDPESDVYTHMKDEQLAQSMTVDSKNILCMYEPLHLMKSIRDKLMEHPILLGTGRVADWQHVVDCYTYERQCSPRLAPKLTADHVQPVGAACISDDLRRTVEVFSESTAAALATYAKVEERGCEAEGGAEWLLTFSRLLQLLNYNSTLRDDGVAFTGEPSQRQLLVALIDDEQSPLRAWRRAPTYKYTAAAEDPDLTACVQRSTITIRSILSLYQQLSDKNCWYPVVGLSNDCIDTFHTKLTQLAEGAPLTCATVIRGVTEVPIFNMFQYYPYKRRSQDLNVFMTLCKQVPSNISLYEQAPEKYSNQCPQHEWARVTLPPEDTVKHLCSHLLQCASLQRQACAHMRMTRPPEVPQHFVIFIEQLEQDFLSFFNEPQAVYSVKELLKHSLMRRYTACACAPVYYIKQLFFTYRLNHLIQFNNDNYKLDHTMVFVVNYL